MSRLERQKSRENERRGLPKLQCVPKATSSWATRCFFSTFTLSLPSHKPNYYHQYCYTRKKYLGTANILFPLTSKTFRLLLLAEEFWIWIGKNANCFCGPFQVLNQVSCMLVIWKFLKCSVIKTCPYTIFVSFPES